MNGKEHLVIFGEREEDIMSPNNEAKESQGKRKEVNKKLRAEEFKEQSH